MCYPAKNCSVLAFDRIAKQLQPVATQVDHSFFLAQFYSIMDMSEGMIFLHVDDPGGLLRSFILNSTYFYLPVYLLFCCINNLAIIWRNWDGTVVRALVSHRGAWVPFPGPGVTCGQNLLLVLVLASIACRAGVISASECSVFSQRKLWLPSLI